MELVVLMYGLFIFSLYFFFIWCFVIYSLFFCLLFTCNVYMHQIIHFHWLWTSMSRDIPQFTFRKKKLFRNLQKISSHSMISTRKLMQPNSIWKAICITLKLNHLSSRNLPLNTIFLTFCKFPHWNDSAKGFSNGKGVKVQNYYQQIEWWMHLPAVSMIKILYNVLFWSRCHNSWMWI